MVYFFHLALGIVLFLVSPLFGQTFQNTKDSHFESYILIENGYPTLILQITPKEGYYIPWKNPDHPQEQSILVNWKQLPDGFLGDWKWNVPERINDVTIGYKNHLILAMRSQKPYESPSTIQGFIEWMVCAQDCSVESAPISLTISPSSTRLYNRKLPEFPLPAPESWKATFRLTNQNLVLELEAENVQVMDFFPENPELKLEPPEIFQIHNSLTNLQLKWNTKADWELVSGLLVTNQGTYEITFIPKSWFYFFQALLYAFLGGIILNLMPCVFPVLAMKAMSLVGDNHRRDSLFYTLGILVFFVLIYMVLYAIQEGGSKLGWGFQLQNPYFVFFLILLFVFLGFLLLGWLEFTVGVSGSFAFLSEKKGGWGAFFSGAIAVLVASPCTAPFMGTALAYALGESFWIGVSVFLSLGLGMAAPMVALQNFPFLTQYLPKPGKWMETLKQFLAFPMFLTAVWLLWVLTGITGRNVGFVALGGIVGLLWLVWLIKTIQKPMVRAILLSLWVGFLVSLFSFVGWKENPPHSIESYGFTNTIEYTEENLNRALQSGKAVFLYFTADWCVTCKFNEANVLKNPNLEDAFRRNQVLVVRADYTNESEEITKKLESFGRNGVPLYVFYASGNSQNPMILPQLLSVEDILKVIEKK